jgi:hypothetical protein
MEMSFNRRFGSHVLAVSVVGGNGSRSVKILARPSRTEERVAELNYQEKTNSMALNMSSSLSAGAKAIELVLSADGAILAVMGDEYDAPERLGQKIIDDLLA